MNPCESFELKLPAYVAGEMSAADAAQFRTHLDGCASCREQAEAMRLLHGAMAMSPLPEKLDAHRVAAIAEKFRAVNQQTAKPKSSSIFARLPNPFAALRRPQNEDGFHWTIIFSRIIPFVALPALMLAAFIYMEATPRNRFAHVLAFRDTKSSSLDDANDELAATPQARTTPTSGKDDTFASGGWAFGKGRASEAAGEPAPPLLKEEDVVVASDTENSIKPMVRSHGGRVALVAQSEVVQSELKPTAEDVRKLSGASGYMIANAVPSEDAGGGVYYRQVHGGSGPARPSLKPGAVAATPPPAPPAMPAPVTRSISGVVNDPQAVVRGEPVNAPAANANYFAYSDKSDTAGNWDNLQKGNAAPAQKSGGFAGNGLSPDPNGPAITLATTSELNGRGEARRGIVAAPGAKAPSDTSALAYDFQTLQGETLAANGTLDGSKLGTLTKTGSGTLSLNGVNTYSGSTVVNAGTLVNSGGTLASDQPLVMKGLSEGRSSGGRDGSEREVQDLASAEKDADEKLGRDVSGGSFFFDKIEAKKEVAKAKGVEEQKALNWFGAAAGGGGAGGGGIAGKKQREQARNGEELAQLADFESRDRGLVTGKQLGLGDSDGDGRLEGLTVMDKKVDQLALNKSGNEGEKRAEAGERQLNLDAVPVVGRLFADGGGQTALGPAKQNEILSKNSVGYARVDQISDARAKRKTASDEVGGEKGKEVDATVSLQTEYPKPQFVGTPVPLKVPNLQPPGEAGVSTRAYSVPKSTMEKFKEGDDYNGLAKHLEEKGLKTPAGSKASYDADTEQLVVTSTPQGLSKFDDVVDALKKPGDQKRAPVTPEPVRPTAPRAPAGFNAYVESAADAFSTFSIDVDTASFTLTRRALDEGRLPDAEQVRTEEIVNAFDYDYAAPANGAFAMHAELAPSPFRAPLELLKVGIQGSVPGRNAKKAAVLTLVIDTSGSMDTADRLGRIRTSLKMLAGKLQPQDSIAIVAFNTEARMLLDRTAGADKARILAAIDSLTPSGSTQLEGGMRVGYEVAARGFVSGAANRVILMSDGVANLGAATAQEILASVSQFRAQGIYLTVLGFGSGTYDDAMLMQLADKGDGMYAFVDSDEEAKRLLVDQWEQTLHVIAKDVKIQIEFNPDRVARWRQIGYEKRQLTKQDFRNDAVDAGEVGSGQAVTALYDIELRALNDGQTFLNAGYLRIPPIATMRVRYKDPDTGKVTELEQRIDDGNRRTDFASAPARFRIAACAAEFAELLRVSPYTAGTDFAAVIEALRPAASQLPLDQRVQELLRMAERARNLAK